MILALSFSFQFTLPGVTFHLSSAGSPRQRIDHTRFWREIAIVSFYPFAVKIDAAVIDIRVITDHTGAFNAFSSNKNQRRTPQSAHRRPMGSIRNPNFMIKTYFFPRGLTFIKSRKQYSTAV